MMLLAKANLCIFLFGVAIGAPLAKEEINSSVIAVYQVICSKDNPCAKEKFQNCIKGKCECEDVSNQIYDFDLKQCAFFVGRNCSGYNNSSKHLEAKCVFNSECNKNSQNCECISGYEPSTNFTCTKILKNNSTSNEQKLKVQIFPYGKSCKNDTDCDSSQDLICSKSSNSSRSSTCDCRNSTYLYDEEKGCFLPYGMQMQDYIVAVRKVQNYRKQRQLLNTTTQAAQNITEAEVADAIDIALRTNYANQLQQLLQVGAGFGNSGGNQQNPFQILNSNEYQPQNNFPQFPRGPINNQNQNAFEQFLNQNQQQSSKEQQLNFPREPVQNSNSMAATETNNNNLGAPSSIQHLQNNGINNQQQHFVNANNNLNQQQQQPQQQQVSNVYPQFPSAPNQFQPFFPSQQQQFQSPSFSLLSLLLNPFTRLLNPQNNLDSRGNPLAPQIGIPFKREIRGLVGFFSRVLNIFLPVLRTLDYQLSPVLTELGKFRYFSNTDNNYAHQQQQQQHQNSQPFTGQQNTYNTPFSFQTNPFAG